MSQFKSGQIIPEGKKEVHCCLHKNLIPLEICFCRKTLPNGYEEPPNYGVVNILSANVLRVKTFLCLDCKKEIKAPDPDSIKKDRL